MKIGIDWIRDFIPVDMGGQELAESLTLAGLEVDGVEAVATGLDGVLVAEILDQRPHPDADRLAICRISDGARELQIVCGAPNAAAGLKVPFAPVGAVLPDGTRIRAAKIRGVRSEGMLCSARELALSDEAAGLLVLDGTAEVGQSLVAYLRLDDSVLDIDLTPNRGDCFSVLGIAREVAARTGREPLDESLDCVDATSEASHDFGIADSAACPRFAGRVITGLATGSRSPDWLRERLRRAGLRAIHPIVDVTNYVMLEYGQPLHAYRLDRLQGPIDVRFSRSGETLTLLDEQELTLDDATLVIADDSGPIGLAGIMGGLATAVDATTDAVFLESAYFAPAALQGRARRYGLHTDASVRFERGVDPYGQERAVERATALLLSIAGGAAGPVLLAEDPAAIPERAPVPLRAERVRAALGIDVAADEVALLLSRLGMILESTADGWLVTPPSYRFDIAIEEDLIEEVGRMIGYDRIPVTAGTSAVRLGAASEHSVSVNHLSDLLVARGFNEVISFGFTEPGLQSAILGADDALTLRNPISRELAVLRQSLWPGLLQTLRLNQSHQAERCRLFETGTVFQADAGSVRERQVIAGLISGARGPVHWDGASASADFYDLKGEVEALLACWHGHGQFEFGRGTHAALKPSASALIRRGDREVGWLGVLHPSLQKSLELRQSAVLFEIDLGASGDAILPRYQEYARLPSVRRDLAVVVDEHVPVADLTKSVAGVIGTALKGCEVFDVYRGQGVDTGRKSVGIGLILQDASRTLTDKETDEMIAEVVRRLEQELGATIRS